MCENGALPSIGLHQGRNVHPRPAAPGFVLCRACRWYIPFPYCRIDTLYSSSTCSRQGNGTLVPLTRGVCFRVLVFVFDLGDRSFVRSSYAGYSPPQPPHCLLKLAASCALFHTPRWECYRACFPSLLLAHQRNLTLNMPARVRACPRRPRPGRTRWTSRRRVGRGRRGT